VAYFEVVLGNLPGNTEQHEEKLGQNGRCFSQDSNRSSQENMSEASPFGPIYSDLTCKPLFSCL
jgi:hypothetical protein